MKQKGLTLVELIVVIAIIAILTAIAIPKVFGFIDNAKSAVDKGNLRTLNNATSLYRLDNSIFQDDTFSGISIDEERMQILVNHEYLDEIIQPKQKNTSFKWEVTDQLWRLYVDGEIISLSPLGDTFPEISSGMIELLQTNLNESGSYGRTWGDYKYTDIGLDPADWNNPINHIYYTPKGSNIQISPEAGYSLVVDDLYGNTKVLPYSYNWNIIYNDVDTSWYYHTIDEANKLNIQTLEVIRD